MALVGLGEVVVEWSKLYGAAGSRADEVWGQRDAALHHEHFTDDTTLNLLTQKLLVSDLFQ